MNSFFNILTFTTDMIVVEERIINAVLSFIASGKIKIFIYDFIGAEWIVSHIITRRVYLNRAH